MTKEQALQLARECSAIIPSDLTQQTDVFAMPYRPLGWVVRFETESRRTTFAELIPAERAVDIHKRSL
jgi:hypothetical protein